MQRNNKMPKRIFAVIMCIALIFSIAIPLFTVAFSASEETDGNIVLTKKYTPTPGALDRGVLTLESYATGERIVTKSYDPIDAVLVLDVSGSLSEVRDVVSWKKGADINSVLSVLNINIGGNVGKCPYDEKSTDKNVIKLVNRWYINHAYYWNIPTGESPCLDRYCDGVQSYSDDCGMPFGFGAMRYYNGSWQYFKATGTNGTGTWQAITANQTYKLVRCFKCSLLKIAAAEFVQKLVDTFGDDASKCNIAIVPFAAGVVEKVKSNINDNEYETCILELTSLSQSDKILETLNSIKHSSSETSIKSGLDKAAEFLKKSSKSGKNRNVIIFSDGDPTYNQNDYSIAETRNDCIVSAKAIKDTGAYIYSVFYNPKSRTGTDGEKCMKYISSAYPKASTMKNTGDQVQDGEKLYFVEGNDNSISEAFSLTVTNMTSGSIPTKYTDKTIVRDVITSEFALDSKLENIRVYKAQCTAVGADGKPTAWGERIDITSELLGMDSGNITYDSITQKVEVKGFDYSSNWCGNETINGVTSLRKDAYKLIIEIPIKTVSTHGSTGIATNTEDSGIIPPDAPADYKPSGDQQFPVPKTDIPTDVKINKVFTGNQLPSGAKFNVEVFAKQSHIIGFEAPDANNYSKAITEDKTFKTTFTALNKTYTVNDILVESSKRVSKIVVTEKAVSSDYEVTIVDNQGNGLVYPKKGNGGDISFEFTVYDGMEITVTNKNLKEYTPPTDATVSIVHTVSGNFGDDEMLFDLRGYYNNDKPFADRVKEGDDPIVFEGLDLNSNFILYENEVEGYTTTVKVNGVPIDPVNNVFVFKVTEDTIVEIDRCCNIKVPVGVHLDAVPYIVIAVFVLIMLSAFFVLKRKKIFN